MNTALTVFLWIASAGIACSFIAAGVAVYLHLRDRKASRDPRP